MGGGGVGHYLDVGLELDYRACEQITICFRIASKRWPRGSSC
jgi:hypothetical protein